MRVMAFLTSVLFLLPVVAAADKGGKGHGRGHGGDAVEPDRGGARAEVTVAFGARDREAARSFFVDAHGRGNCPPGLAKKHNGCLPPGQAKKRYAVGHALPRGIAYAPPGFLVRIINAAMASHSSRSALPNATGLTDRSTSTTFRPPVSITKRYAPERALSTPPPA